MYSMPRTPVSPNKLAAYPAVPAAPMRPSRRCHRNRPVTATSPNVADSGASACVLAMSGTTPARRRKLKTSTTAEATPASAVSRKSEEDVMRDPSVRWNNMRYYRRYRKLPAMASTSKRRVERPPAGTINERLVAAALQLLREESPADLTVRRIAEVAGTTTMCLYTGFGSRDGLLDAVYAQGFEQLRRDMAQAKLVADPGEAVRRLLQAYRAFALANPGLYGLLFERVLPGFDPSPQVRRTALDTTFGLLTAQAGRLLGTDPQDGASREFGYTLWALTHGLVSLELIARQPQPAGRPSARRDRRAGRPRHGPSGGAGRLEPGGRADLGLLDRTIPKSLDVECSICSC